MSESKPSTSSLSPGDPQLQPPPQQAVQDTGDEEETDSEDELEEIDLDKGNDGVQKNIAKLFKILVKDRRKETEHRSEVRKPTDFKGTENSRDARNWIDSFERYYSNRKVKKDEEKINTTLSYLVGKASDFARRIQKELDTYDAWNEDYEGESNPPPAPKHCASWADFKKRFLHEFVDADPVQTAREEIRKLRMESDQRAEEFLTEFKNLAIETGYGDEALIDMLQVALIPRITSKILEMRKRPEDVDKDVPNYRPETLDEWYEVAGDLDRSYRLTRQRMTEIKGQGAQRSKTTPTPETNAPRNNSNNGYRNNFRNNSGGGQGSGNNRRVQYQTRAVKDMSEVICYRCDKKGHISRDCPTRASGSGQQQNKQTTNLRTLDISDDTLELLTRALQSASAQRNGASTKNGKGKEPEKGFRRNRK